MIQRKNKRQGDGGHERARQAKREKERSWGGSTGSCLWGWCHIKILHLRMPCEPFKFSKGLPLLHKQRREEASVNTVPPLDPECPACWRRCCNQGRWCELLNNVVDLPHAALHPTEPPQALKRQRLESEGFVFWWMETMTLWVMECVTVHSRWLAASVQVARKQELPEPV